MYLGDDAPVTVTVPLPSTQTLATADSLIPWGLGALAVYFLYDALFPTVVIRAKKTGKVVHRSRHWDPGRF
jgi:hypothetical protein